MSPLQKPITVVLGGVERQLVFDMNTFAAYEEKTGKFFLDTMTGLFGVFKEVSAANSGELSESQLASIGASVLSRVSMVDLRALLWSALHEYDSNDEPTWPLTINQVGRLIDISTVMQFFSSFIDGSIANSPLDSELPPEREGRPTEANPGSGGTPSGRSLDTISDSPSENSAA